MKRKLIAVAIIWLGFGACVFAQGATFQIFDSWVDIGITALSAVASAAILLLRKKEKK